MKVKWTKFYDWRVVFLQGPSAVYGEITPGKKELLKYDVVVIYKHHGTKTVSFNVDYPMMSGPTAYRKACDYYNDLLIKNKKSLVK